MKRDMSGTAYCLDCRQRAEHERGPGSPLSIKHLDGCPQNEEPRKHELRIDVVEPSRRTGGAKKLRGVCSCGARQPVAVNAAGLCHGWHNDHINRFPQLTAAIVIAAATASAQAQLGKPVIALHALEDADLMAGTLRMMATGELRDAEQVALDLLAQAHREVEEHLGRKTDDPESGLETTERTT